jgi:hypothetical protein
MTIKIENAMNATAQDIVMALLSMADEKQCQQLQRFYLLIGFCLQQELLNETV